MIIGSGITIGGQTVYQNSPIVVGNIPVQTTFTYFITETLNNDLTTEDGYLFVEEN